MRRTAITLAVAALLASPLAWAGSHAESEQKAQVRVAGGSLMEQAGSARSQAEWAEKRPDYQALKPGQRSE